MRLSSTPPLALALFACTQPRAVATADAPAPPPPISTTIGTPTPTVTSSSTLPSAAPASALDAEATAAPPGMLLVPAGPFTMGLDRLGQEDEHPAHTVTVRGFYLDRLEVTNAEYAACVAARACARNDTRIASETHGGDDAIFTAPDHPVVGVTWNDARAYCEFRGKRLPREAEYEKAMRDADSRRYAWGDDPPTPERAVFGRKLGTGTTDAVGTHPAGRGPYGHEDLAGNVWEWMEDEYDPLAYTRPSAPEGKPGTCAEILAAQDKLRAQGRQGFTGSNPIPTECEHVLRGGAFNYDGWGLRATNRVHHPGHFRLVMAGLRCAKDTL